MNAPDAPFPFDEAILDCARRLEAKVIAWRRDLHANPELGNREFRTAKVVAAPNHSPRFYVDEECLAIG